MMRLCLLWFLISFSGFIARGHEHVSDEKHNYHVGLGFAEAWMSDVSGLKPSIHLHFIRQLGEQRNWGLGLGYESIAGKPLHQGMYIIYNRQIINKLSVNIAPGITFSKNQASVEVNPAAHFEVIYEIDAGKVHLGPMIGFGIDPEDLHFSAGIHIGFGF